MKTVIRILFAALCAVPLLAGAADQAKANEKVVLDFIAAMDRATANGAVEEVPKIAEQFWTEDCVQHRAGMMPGRAALIESLQKLPAFAKPQPATRAATFKTLSISSAEDRVIMIRRKVEGDSANPSKKTEQYIFNVYRIENGKIAENWWALSYLPPAAEGSSR